MSELVREVIGSAEDRHVTGGVCGGSIDGGPVDGPSGVPKHLVEEDALAATVPVTEGMDQSQFRPVCGNGVGGGVAIGRAGRLRGDQPEDPIEFIAEELGPRMGDAECAGIRGAEFTSPHVEILQDVPVDGPEVGEVEIAGYRVLLEL